MKIAFVTDSIYPYHKGGKEKRLYELSTRLAQQGHDIHIYTMHWWDSPEKTQQEDGLTLHAISKRHEMYVGDRRSIKEGVLFGIATLKMFKVKADVIDVDHMPFFPVYGTWFVTKIRGRKLYGTWHESLTRKEWTDYMGKAGLLASAIEHISIKLPDHITAASPRTLQSLGELHGRKGRLDLITPGIDIKLINSLKPATINCDVLFIGRLVKDKNVDKLVQAVGIIAKKNPKIRCIIVGHGVERPRLVKMIKQLKLIKQVNLQDPLPEAKDIYAYMKAAKVFCLPSVREGFGMVALEALGCGTPVITVDSPANAARDLIQDGKNGSLVSLDPKEIAEAIEHWISVPKPRNLARQVSQYDWNGLAFKQAEVYAA